ncbi:hypothetical protein [Mangrovicoccus ximenensis]|uniref:hypothetical protein n=1 Tax=Mangrovicoccus ximenensis TaxID=1911570 RepID=UPI0013753475|nr:hypothetical protein [Mangrovicoccus ximenensis]
MCRDLTAPELEPCKASYEAGEILPGTSFTKAGGVLLFYGINWLLVALGRPELLRTHDLKASLRAGGRPVPLPTA